MNLDADTPVSNTPTIAARKDLAPEQRSLEAEAYPAIPYPVHPGPPEAALREAFEKVEQAKREWESTVDSLSEVVCLVDAKGLVIRANQAVDDWNLCQVKKVKGIPFHALAHPNCSKPACPLDTFLRQAIDATRQQQEAQCEIDDPILKRYVLIRSRPVLLGGNRSTRTTVLVIEDITERKRTEASEREQRALAEALRDTAAALNSTLQPDQVLDRILANVQRVITYDAACLVLLDSGAATVVRSQVAEGNSAEERLLPRSGPQLIEAPSLRRMLETGRPFVVPHVGADMSTIDLAEIPWIQSYVGAPIQVKGQVSGFLNLYSGTPGFFSPTHAERLQAFASQAALALENAQLYAVSRHYADELKQRVLERTVELQREREQLATILDTAGEAIALSSHDWTIRFVNPAIERLTGYSLAEMQGTSLRLWDNTLTAPAVQEDIQRSLACGETWQGEVINRRKDGSAYNASLTITPLGEQFGQRIGYVSVQHDITHLKALDQLRNQFVTRIGHELRTPLTNLILTLTLLERGKIEKREGYMSTLHSEAERLRKLVEGFLEISELDANAEPPELVPTDLHRLTVDLVDNCSSFADERGITLDYQHDSLRRVPPALGNIALLTRATSTLIDNALRYTSPGGRVTCTLEMRQLEQAEWVTLTVRDTGPGIAPSEMPRLFERFYRGEAARDFKTPGIGMGLSICEGIVHRLGGRITVDSVPDQGAAFTIWLKPASVNTATRSV